MDSFIYYVGEPGASDTLKEFATHATEQQGKIFAITHSSNLEGTKTYIGFCRQVRVSGYPDKYDLKKTVFKATYDLQFADGKIHSYIPSSCNEMSMRTRLTKGPWITRSAPDESRR